MKTSSKKSKTKTVLQTVPTLFSSPFKRLRYVLIQDPAQFSNFKNPSLKELQFNSAFDEDGFRAIEFLTHHETEGYFAIIYYPGMFDDHADDALETICHECVHVWQDFSSEVIFERSPSIEFEAYTIAEFFRNAVEEYRKLSLIHQAHQKEEEQKQSDVAA